MLGTLWTTFFLPTCLRAIASSQCRSIVLPSIPITYSKVFIPPPIKSGTHHACRLGIWGGGALPHRKNTKICVTSWIQTAIVCCSKTPEYTTIHVLFYPVTGYLYFNIAVDRIGGPTKLAEAYTVSVSQSIAVFCKVYSVGRGRTPPPPPLAENGSRRSPTSKFLLTHENGIGATP